MTDINDKLKRVCTLFPVMDAVTQHVDVESYEFEQLFKFVCESVENNYEYLSSLSESDLAFAEFGLLGVLRSMGYLTSAQVDEILNTKQGISKAQGECNE